MNISIASQKPDPQAKPGSTWTDYTVHIEHGSYTFELEVWDCRDNCKPEDLRHTVESALLINCALAKCIRKPAQEATA